MRYSAKKEKWTPMEIKGIHGYFNDLRIDRASVPGWFHFWELQTVTAMGRPAGTSRTYWSISTGRS